MITLARRMLIVALLAVIGAFWGLSRLDAQEATPEAIATPVAPIVVEDGGTVIVEAPQDAPTNDTYVAIGAALFGFVSVCAVIVQRGNAAEATRRELARIQANREAMVRYERFYADATQAQRTAFDTAVGAIKLFAPLTPTEIDNALGEFLEDLQTPGPPEPPAPGSLSLPKRD